VNQSHHAVRDSDGDAGGHQAPLSGSQFDVFGTAEIDARITVMGTGGHREIAVQANHRKAGGHDPRDYPWPGDRCAHE
jgi:hypothetical protein